MTVRDFLWGQTHSLSRETYRHVQRMQALEECVCQTADELNLLPEQTPEKRQQWRERMDKYFTVAKWESTIAGGINDALYVGLLANNISNFLDTNGDSFSTGNLLSATVLFGIMVLRDGYRENLWKGRQLLANEYRRLETEPQKVVNEFYFSPIAQRNNLSPR